MSAKPGFVSPALWRLGLDLGSGYAYLALMALVTLFLVPVYVRLLGSASWGVVALCLTLHGVLFAVDVAIAPLALRDVARAAQRGRAYAAYRRYRRLYGGIALAAFALAQVALAVAELAGLVAASLAWPLRIVLVQFVFQFANNAATGYWIGRERQRYANLRLAAFALAKHAAALALIVLWRAEPVVWLAPFAVIGAFEFAANASRIRREAAGEPSDDDGEHDGWRGVAGYGVAAALGVASTQIDRVVLSFALPAERYGAYFLVASLMLSLLQLQVPIHRAFMPRIATAGESRRPVRAMFATSIVVLTLPCLALAFVPELVLRLWLGDASVAADGAPVLRLMLVAVALTALFATANTVLVSRRRYRTLIAVAGTVLAVQAFLLVSFVATLGPLAGALAWLGGGIVQAGFAAAFWQRGLARETAR